MLTRRTWPDATVAELLIAQLARAPIPGQVKTRLLPALDAQRAADLHAAMVLYICRHLVPAGRLQLWVEGDMTAPLFSDCLAAGADSLQQQRGEDLGARMAHIVDSGLANSGKVVLVGSDAPGLNAGHIAAIDEALESADAVFIPALDGGYVSLGLTLPCSELFADMPWGTDRVLELSLAALAASGRRAAVLEPVPDIDRPEDLRYLPDDLHW